MTCCIFIEPKKKICKFCKKKIHSGFLWWFFTLDSEDSGYCWSKTVTKDGIRYIYTDDYYHERCAIKNFQDKYTN